MVFQQGTQRGDGPVRTCVGCRQKAARRELVRVVVRSGPDTQAAWWVEPDPAGSAPGRGAHLHPSVECLAKAERTRAFTRALRHDAAARGALDLGRLRQHLAEEQHPAPPQPAPIRNGSTSS